MRRLMLSETEDEEVKEWKKIYDTVLEEEKTVVIVENDLDGEPIELEEFAVFMRIKANEAGETHFYTRIGINKNNVNESISQGSDAVPGSGDRYSLYGFRRIGENTWMLEYIRSSVNTNLGAGGSYGMDIHTGTDRANAIVINFMVNAGVGTEIRIYGR